MHLLLLLLAVAQPVLRWTDKQGGVHYTNDAATVPKGVKATVVKSDDGEYLRVKSDEEQAVEDAGAPAVPETVAEDEPSSWPEAPTASSVLLPVDAARAKTMPAGERRAQLALRRSEIRAALRTFSDARRELEEMPAGERAHCFTEKVPAECQARVSRFTKLQYSAPGVLLGPFTTLNVLEAAEGLEPTPLPPAMQYVPLEAPSVKPKCRPQLAAQRTGLEAYLARQKALPVSDEKRFSVEVATDHLRNLGEEERRCTP